MVGSCGRAYGRGGVFDDNDELKVLTRDGNKESLMVSAFAESLGNCLVHLDEAHTRGTDLKLPIGSKAACSDARA